ncbi:MAG: sugar O-acetyltransferase [Lachnospiraceae bacterium]|nr:sugar O-acetyltransferase [Lachnospiraceae bacterium]
MRNEKEVMLKGELYDPNVKELIDLRTKAHRLSFEYNQTLDSDDEKRKEIINELIPNLGEGAYLQGPIQVDYGCFTTIGERTYANFNLTILDTCPVKIGNDVFIGPNVSLLTAMHPLRWQERNTYYRDDNVLTDKEYGKPITIEDNCWIAGNVTICGGVTVGEGSVIGAGSVVVKDIPANSLAAGNPCRVIRKITNKDRMINE